MSGQLLNVGHGESGYLPGMRRRAILFCLIFGLVPYCLYEATPHSDLGYFDHLRLNLRTAARWVTGRETVEDVDFERSVNWADRDVTALGPADREDASAAREVAE